MKIRSIKAGVREVFMDDDKSVLKLERELAVARSKESAAFAEYTSSWQDDQRDQAFSARTEVCVAERKLAAARGEPYAIPAEFPIRWSMGAPMPFVMSDGYRTFLTFYVDVPDPEWDGTSTTVITPSSPDTYTLCAVTIDQCVLHRFGAPDEDILYADGHPLSGKGLEPYTAQVIVDSPWLVEYRAMQGEADQDGHDVSYGLKHFAFWFHDNSFECLAQAIHGEVTRESMRSLLER